MEKCSPSKFGATRNVGSGQTMTRAGGQTMQYPLKRSGMRKSCSLERLKASSSGTCGRQVKKETHVDNSRHGVHKRSRSAGARSIRSRENMGTCGISEDINTGKEFECSKRLGLRRSRSVGSVVRNDDKQSSNRHIGMGINRSTPNVNKNSHTSSDYASERSVELRGKGTFGGIYKLWRKGEFCDVKIYADGAEFFAHSLVMAANCQNFTVDSRAVTHNAYTEYTVTNVSAEVMGRVVRYFYTADIEVHRDNVCELLEVSQQLGISKIYDASIVFLKRLTTRNVLNNMRIAEDFNLKQAIVKINKYINSHFKSIVTTKSYRQSDFRTIYSLLSTNILADTDPISIFQACKTWIDYDKSHRMKYATVLMRLVCFYDIPAGDIVVELEPVQDIFHIPECKDLLYQAFRRHALRHDHPQEFEEYHVNHRHSDEGIRTQVMVGEPSDTRQHGRLHDYPIEVLNNTSNASSTNGARHPAIIDTHVSNKGRRRRRGTVDVNISRNSIGKVYIEPYIRWRPTTSDSPRQARRPEPNPPDNAKAHGGWTRQAMWQEANTGNGWMRQRSGSHVNVRPLESSEGVSHNLTEPERADRHAQEIQTVTPNIRAGGCRRRTPTENDDEEQSHDHGGRDHGNYKHAYANLEQIDAGGGAQHEDVTIAGGSGHEHRDAPIRRYSRQAYTQQVGATEDGGIEQHGGRRHSHKARRRPSCHVEDGHVLTKVAELEKASIGIHGNEQYENKRYDGRRWRGSVIDHQRPGHKERSSWDNTWRYDRGSITDHKERAHVAIGGVDDGVSVNGHQERAHVTIGGVDDRLSVNGHQERAHVDDRFSVNGHQERAHVDDRFSVNGHQERAHVNIGVEDKYPASVHQERSSKVTRGEMEDEEVYVADLKGLSQVTTHQCTEDRESTRQGSRPHDSEPGRNSGSEPAPNNMTHSDMPTEDAGVSTSTKRRNRNTLTGRQPRNRSQVSCNKLYKDSRGWSQFADPQVYKYACPCTSSDNLGYYAITEEETTDEQSTRKASSRRNSGGKHRTTRKPAPDTSSLKSLDLKEWMQVRSHTRNQHKNRHKDGEDSPGPNSDKLSNRQGHDSRRSERHQSSRQAATSVRSKIRVLEDRIQDEEPGQSGGPVQAHKEDEGALAPAPSVPDMIMVMGGLNPDCENGECVYVNECIQQYDIEYNVWRIRSYLPIARFHFALAYLNGQLYAIGGMKSDDGQKIPVDDCYSYNVRMDTWQNEAALNTGRWHHRVITLNGFIYAVGGEDSRQTSLNTVEVYDPDKGRWKCTPAMVNSRGMPTVVTHKGCVMVAGGILHNNTMLDSVEVFDPSTGAWTTRLSLPVPMCAAGAAEIDGVVYLVGGFTVQGSIPASLDNVYQYVYNSETEGWVNLVQLCVPRHDHIVVALGHCIVILGGEAVSVDGDVTYFEPLAYVECIDVQQGCINIDMPQLLIPAHGLAGCLMAPSAADQHVHTDHTTQWLSRNSEEQLLPNTHFLL